MSSGEMSSVSLQRFAQSNPTAKCAIDVGTESHAVSHAEVVQSVTSRRNWSVLAAGVIATLAAAGTAYLMATTGALTHCPHTWMLPVGISAGVVALTALAVGGVVYYRAKRAMQKSNERLEDFRNQKLSVSDLYEYIANDKSYRRAAISSLESVEQQQLFTYMLRRGDYDRGLLAVMIEECGVTTLLGYVGSPAEAWATNAPFITQLLRALPVESRYAGIFVAYKELARDFAKETLERLDPKKAWEEQREAVLPLLESIQNEAGSRRILARYPEFVKRLSTEQCFAIFPLMRGDEKGSFVGHLKTKIREVATQVDVGETQGFEGAVIQLAQQPKLLIEEWKTSPRLFTQLLDRISQGPNKEMLEEEMRPVVKEMGLESIVRKYGSGFPLPLALLEVIKGDQEIAYGAFRKKDAVLTTRILTELQRVMSDSEMESYLERFAKECTVRFRTNPAKALYSDLDKSHPLSRLLDTAIKCAKHDV